MKKYIFLIITAVGLSVSTKGQTDTTQWSSSRSNGGFSERLFNVIKDSKDQREARQNAPAKAQVTESLATKAAGWPTKNKLASFLPYPGTNWLKGDRYCYVNLEKDSTGTVTKIWTANFLNDDGTQKEPTLYKAYAPPMYHANSWFFSEPIINSYDGQYRYNRDEGIYITDESIVWYKVNKWNEPEIKTLIGVGGKKGKNVSTWTKEIEAYRRWAMEKQKSDVVELTEAEKAFREQHSLEHREVTKIKIVYTDETEQTGALPGGTINFGLEATFKDGSSDKTHNLGGNLYIEDFVVDGFQYGDARWIGRDYRTDEWGGHSHKLGAELKIWNNNAPAPGAPDLLTFTVKPKYKGSGQAKVSLVFQYPTIVSLPCGSGGSSTTIEAKMSKHSETGKALIYCKVGKNRYVKFQSGGTLKANAAGMPGSKGTDGSDCSEAFCKAGDGGDGGRGGNGGNITLLIQPSASGKFKHSLQVGGGPGGDPGLFGKAWSDTGTDGSSGSRGEKGSPGVARVVTQNVSF